MHIVPHLRSLKSIHAGGRVAKTSALRVRCMGGGCYQQAGGCARSSGVAAYVNGTAADPALQHAVRDKLCGMGHISTRSNQVLPLTHGAVTAQVLIWQLGLTEALVHQGCWCTATVARARPLTKLPVDCPCCCGGDGDCSVISAPCGKGICSIRAPNTVHWSRHPSKRSSSGALTQCRPRQGSIPAAARWHAMQHANRRWCAECWTAKHPAAQLRVKVPKVLLLPDGHSQCIVSRRL